MQKILSFMLYRPLPSLLFFARLLVIIIAIIILIKMKVDFIKLFLYFIESCLLFYKKPSEAEPQVAEVKKEGPEIKKEGPENKTEGPENKTEDYQFDEAPMDNTPNDARSDKHQTRADNTSSDDAPNASPPKDYLSTKQEGDIKIDRTVAKEPQAPVLDLKPFTPVPSGDANNLSNVYYSTTGDWIIQARGGVYVEVADDETQVSAVLTAREHFLYKSVNDDAALQNVKSKEPVTTTLDRLGYDEDEIYKFSQITNRLEVALIRKKEENEGPAKEEIRTPEGDIIYDELIKPAIDLGNTPPEQRVKAPSEQVD